MMHVPQAASNTLHVPAVAVEERVRLGSIVFVIALAILLAPVGSRRCDRDDWHRCLDDDSVSIASIRRRAKGPTQKKEAFSQLSALMAPIGHGDYP